MTLTAKQEAFCLAYLETGNASEAYRQAYNAERMKPETVNRTAKELLDNPKITARLSELRAPVVERAQYTLEQHLERLRMLSEAAEQANQFSAAIAAETNRGKVSGFYTEKHEHSGPNGGPIPTMPTTIELVAPNVESED